MTKSQTKLRSCSDNNSKGRYANIICTIAIAVLGLMWTTIEYRLTGLDARLRSVEQRLAAISDRLGIEETSTRAHTFDLRGSATAWLPGLSDPAIAELYQQKQGLQGPAR